MIAVGVSPQATGVGLAQGLLYHDDNQTLFGEELDGLQVTLPTVSVENDLGYMLSPSWGLGVHS